MNYFYITYRTSTGQTSRFSGFEISIDAPFFNREKVCDDLKHYHKVSLNEDVNPIIISIYKFENKEEYDCFTTKK
jgi:hypothetical protein